LQSLVDKKARILSKTFVNNNAVRQITAEHTGIKSKFSSVDCDTIVPCKMPKYNDNNFHESRINHSKGILLYNF